MKLQFNSENDYQLRAIQSVVDIFEGQNIAKSDFEVNYTMSANGSIEMTEKGICNKLNLSVEQLLENVQKIQTRNNINVSDKLEPCTYISSENESKEFLPNITIEMETGTGKTYTFLRTIYELNRMYGFKKFVIVVPSVAIREGSIKNLDITKEHFQNLYNKPNVNFIVYDSRKITELRNFAISNSVEILVINIDSFNKDNNIINTVRETGVKPIEYVQNTNPIVIIDEPQNMEAEMRKQAIHNLNPLCTLRYSATHRNFYNLVYSLNPVQAYDMGLVKHISVDGITSDNYNNAFIHFKDIKKSKHSIAAKLTIFVNEKNSPVQKDITIEPEDDLYNFSGKRDTYKFGFILNSINATEGIIKFSNGLTMKKGETNGGLTEETIKYQIERTITSHFENIKKLVPKKIKVLSLFFIDRVANYRVYDEKGNPSKGIYAKWFEESFVKQLNENQEVLNVFKTLSKFETLTALEIAAKVHDGYFSQDKKGIFKDTGGETQDDEKTYDKIMKNKEQLLSLDEPLQFIFSHSALREGWDNPNVFQICTLNEAKSEIKKRQEIGRGLRLPVNSEGIQIKDKNINTLTVIASESYLDFSKALQTEIETETGVEFKGRIKDKNKKATLIKLNKELTESVLFNEIWEKIKYRTRYNVDIDKQKLINTVVERMNDYNDFPTTRTPKLHSTLANLSFDKYGIVNDVVQTNTKKIESNSYSIPDIYSYIQTRVFVTRDTIFQILITSDRWSEILINPQMFLDNFVRILKSSLQSLMVDGIKYEKINETDYAVYDMTLFEKEIESYEKDFFEVQNFEKTMYDKIPTESITESQFANDCETESKVKFYFKIPKKFKITTPLGDYSPDWALILENDNRIYFVAETKSDISADKLRPDEKMKIKCGAEHFKEIENVKYQAVTKLDELII